MATPRRQCPVAPSKVALFAARSARVQWWAENGRRWCEMARVAINGLGRLGRIGRAALKILLDTEGLDWSRSTILPRPTTSRT
jgi:hypothetical protein